MYDPQFDQKISVLSIPYPSGKIYILVVAVVYRQCLFSLEYSP